MVTSLYCALCWYLPAKDESDAVAAVSIANGYALCEDHMDIEPTPAAMHAVISMAWKDHNADD